MKTQTEILGIPLREAYRIRADLVRTKRTKDKTEKTPVSDPKPERAKTATEIEAKIKSPEERLEELKKRKAEMRERRRQEWLALLESIKEPLTLKLKEKFSWREEQLQHVIRALDVIDRRRVQDLRRVVVLKPDKDEEALPKHGQKIENLVYLAEYLPPKTKPKNRASWPDKRRRKGRKKFKKKGKRYELKAKSLKNGKPQTV